MLQTLPIGDHFSLVLERTLRVPNDGGTYPLPPGLGEFPIYPRLEIPRTASAELPEADYYVPMYQSEALWFRFIVPRWLPHAVQIAAGGVNVLTGTLNGGRLTADPQDYLCCPNQPWLDGIRTAPGVVSQFVAAPLGTGLTLEEQLKAGPAEGGVTVRVIPPKPGLFEKPKPIRDGSSLRCMKRLGLGGGGCITQKIYPDPHGLDTWDQSRAREIRIQILNSAEFETLTGFAAPPTPVTVEAYARHKLPWFRLYDEAAADLGVTAALAGLKTVANDDSSLTWVPVLGIRKT
jgi:hypothetical protein